MPLLLIPYSSKVDLEITHCQQWTVNSELTLNEGRDYNNLTYNYYLRISDVVVTKCLVIVTDVPASFSIHLDFFNLVYLIEN